MPSGNPAAPDPQIPIRDLSRDQWKRVAKDVYERFGEVAITDRAATLSYYGFLSLFPGLIVAVSLLALFGTYPETYEKIIETLREAAPGTAVDTIDSALRNVLKGQSAGSLLGAGVVAAFVTASGAVGAAIRALEAINGTREAASFVRSNLTRLWLALALMFLFLIAFTALLIAGPIFQSVAEAAGFGDSGREAVSASRYPVGILALLAATLMLYSLGPAGTPRRLVEHVPGALLAVALWVLASIGFSFYVSKFSTYDATYGTLGAVIVLLIWLYVTNLALLLGALFNRELWRVRDKKKTRSRKKTQAKK